MLPLTWFNRLDNANWAWFLAFSAMFFYHTKIYYKQKQATIEKGVNFAQNAATLCIKKIGYNRT